MVIPRITQRVYDGTISGFDSSRKEAEAKVHAAVARGFVKTGVIGALREAIDGIKQKSKWRPQENGNSASTLVRVKGPAPSYWKDASGGEPDPDPTIPAFVEIFNEINPRLSAVFRMAPYPFYKMHEDGRLPFGNATLTTQNTNIEAQRPRVMTMEAGLIEMNVAIGTASRRYLFEEGEQTYQSDQIAGQVLVATPALIKGSVEPTVGGPLQQHEGLHSWRDTDMAASFKPSWTREETKWIPKIQTLLVSPDIDEKTETDLVKRLGAPPSMGPRAATRSIDSWSDAQAAYKGFFEELALTIAKGVNLPTERELRARMNAIARRDSPKDATGTTGSKSKRRRVPKKAAVQSGKP